MNQTLNEQYVAIMSTNLMYQRNRDHWDYLLNSYMGGVEYQRGQYLTRYVNETEKEYAARIDATHLENHCKSVISTYVSFLFREEPEREFGTLTNDAALLAFLEDADMDGRSFDAFMKEVAVWSSVFGHAWVLIVKPNIGAITLGEEQAVGVRPYVNLVTPLTVTDWMWNRKPTGQFELTYFKYIEESNDTFATVREWTKDTITTTIVNNRDRIVKEQTIEVNGLGEIPAVLAYNHRSPVRGIGVSDISDIAMAQKTIYNLTSECEQSVRINGHPALAATAGTELSAGAGAVIRMEDNLDPGLRPFMLAVSTDINSIFTAINHVTESIDKMANTGSIRATESRRMSAVAQQQEFELLNAKLSEKADNIQLTEEQIWQWFCQYQGRVWDGEIEYPGSFNIRDTQAEVDQLVKAKQAATNPKVLDIIDGKIVELLGEDPEVLFATDMLAGQETLPPQPVFEPHIMCDPVTGKEYIARTEQEHLDYAALGYYHKEEY
jgi:hypothetical protein